MLYRERFVALPNGTRFLEEDPWNDPSSRVYRAVAGGIPERYSTRGSYGTAIGTVMERVGGFDNSHPPFALLWADSSFPIQEIGKRYSAVEVQRALERWVPVHDDHEYTVVEDWQPVPPDDKSGAKFRQVGWKKKKLDQVELERDSKLWAAAYMAAHS